MEPLEKNRSFAKKGLKVVGMLAVAVFFMETVLLASGAVGNCSLRITNPDTSAFIRNFEIQSRKKIRLRWKNLDEISRNLIKAVVVAEDAAFFEHIGFDLHEMKASLKTNWKKKKIARGGSTLTMQLVKNLYLSGDKSPLRKLNEIILALDLENKVPKERILEVYLNIAEWGYGIYGADAASRHYFGKAPGDLAPTEAAYLAALLPNPVYLSKKGTRRAERRQAIILRRMGRSLPPPPEADQPPAEREGQPL
jgi:monofunctional biosynthetic peptidoglycan transglycosylase